MFFFLPFVLFLFCDKTKLVAVDVDDQENDGTKVSRGTEQSKERREMDASNKRKKAPLSKKGKGQQNDDIYK